MAEERHLVERHAAGNAQSTIKRAIFSPCPGCKLVKTISKNEEEGDRPGIGVCPKQVFYARKEALAGAATLNFNLASPIFDEKLLGKNPVWAGQMDHGNAYNLAYAALYEDNEHNKDFDTKDIVCSGPYLVKTPERWLHTLGYPAPGFTALVEKASFMLDGVQFEGLIEEADIWQITTAVVREIDKIIGKVASGK